MLLKEKKIDLGAEPILGAKKEEAEIAIEIKEDKIWIHQDWAEGVVDDFIKMGMPKSDLVLAFLAPYKRPYATIAAA